MGITEPCYHQALTAEHARLSTQSTLPSCLRDWNGLSVAASLGGKGEEARELTPNHSGTNWLKAAHIAAALVAWTKFTLIDTIRLLGKFGNVGSS